VRFFVSSASAYTAPAASSAAASVVRAREELVNIR
jgi:hypothetical protein